jgi:succinyl-CoA synthetase beta subunit
MNIHEYQAKQILRKYGVPTSHGVVALRKEEIDSLIDSLNANIYVVKAQIHAGGRGKAGGVKVVRSKEEAKKHAHAMFGSCLTTHQTGPEGQKVRRVYIEAGCDILKEYYFSCVFDRNSSSITFMASTEGGVDIEEVAEHSPEKIIKVIVDSATGIQPFHCRQIAFELDFKDEQAKQMMKIVESTYQAFVATDANQIEINPLVVTQEGNLLALDAKINFDDNGLFRRPDIQAMRDEDEEDLLETRASKEGLSYVKMDGSIGCMVNGAGLAMATMDIIKLYGAQPANFLDVGGGADRERVTEAFKIITSDSSVQGILVNIFGGIMRCDIIAEGIVAAAKEVGLKVPLVVRLAGTNFELGKKILSDSGLKIIAADDLADAASKVVASVK